jgi:hypothetical protein
MKLRNDARPSSDVAYTIFGWILLRGTRSTPERTQLPLAKGSLAGWVSRSHGGTRTGIDPALIHVYANEFVLIGRTDAAVCLKYNSILTHGPQKPLNFVADTSSMGSWLRELRV